MYTVNYHTGAGNGTAETLDDAKKVADNGACYTQESITIEDENGQTVSMRHWWDCMDGIEGMENPIRFGAYGYYGDWEDAV